MTNTKPRCNSALDWVGFVTVFGAAPAFLTSLGLNGASSVWTPVTGALLGALVLVMGFLALSEKRRG
jgi:hypothetical protein